MYNREFYKTTWFLLVCGIILPVVGLLLLLLCHKDKPRYFKIALTAFFVIWTVGILAFSTGNIHPTEETMPQEEKAVFEETNAEKTTEAAKEAFKEKASGEKKPEEAEGDSEVDQLRATLKEKYDVDEPTLFVRGDRTGDWRIVKVANGTAPAEYAVDYAKAYMNEGTIHYIVNFSLKTTSMFRKTLGVLEVKTTEYVEDEEHDASVIGEGLLLDDVFFDLETGEKISAEADPNAGTVENDALISAVQDAISGAIGEGEKITDVSFDGKDLKITVDLSEIEVKLGTPRDVALSRISSITDNILDLDDSYYNTWETITLDFGAQGTIRLDKSMVADQGLGRYFNFKDDDLE